MHTQVVNETEGDQRGHKQLIRVAVAGATGFAGQELIRLLARHPNVTITVATGSQATSTPRRLPSLAKIWDGTVVPLNAAAFAADAVFLALPEAASAELAPVAAGVGPARDRSVGRVPAARRRPRARSGIRRRTALPDGVAYGLTEFELDGDPPARSWCRTRAATRPPRCSGCCRCSAPGC